jgi:hypothetical protein
MPTFTIDPEQQYSASIDSVNLINILLAKPSLTEEEQECIMRNVEHLKIMVAKDFWTDEDLTPLTDAITAGENIQTTQDNDE